MTLIPLDRQDRTFDILKSFIKISQTQPSNTFLSSVTIKTKSAPASDQVTAILGQVQEVYNYFSLQIHF